MEKCNLDPVKSPIIQEIILSNRIGSISDEISKRLDIEPLKALELFYASKNCEDLHNKETGLYLYSDLYVVDELLFEQKRENYMSGIFWTFAWI